MAGGGRRLCLKALHSKCMQENIIFTHILYLAEPLPARKKMKRDLLCGDASAKSRSGHRAVFRAPGPAARRSEGLLGEPKGALGDIDALTG